MILDGHVHDDALLLAGVLLRPPLPVTGLGDGDGPGPPQRRLTHGGGLDPGLPNSVEDGEESLGDVLHGVSLHYLCPSLGAECQCNEV